MARTSKKNKLEIIEKNDDQVLDERKSEIKYINDYSLLNEFLNELYKEIADDSYNK